MRGAKDVKVKSPRLADCLVFGQSVRVRGALEWQKDTLTDEAMSESLEKFGWGKCVPVTLLLFSCP